MGQLIALPRRATDANGAANPEHNVPTVRTTEIYAVFTSIDETLAAVRVANTLARALAVPLTLIHFRSVPYELPIDAPDGPSPIETGGFVDRLRAEGVNARVRVYLCRNARQSIRAALKRHSVIVIGGRHRWWPTRAERWRQALEAEGHFVVFVDAREHKERSHA